MYNLIWFFLFSHKLKLVIMRNLKSISLLTAILLIAFVACKKDKNPPTISILGDNPASVTVGSTYIDEGATAVNPDETSTEVTTDLSAINTASSGSFEVTYTAENEYGSSSLARSVNVFIGQSNYVGTYDLSSDCGATAFPLNVAQEGVALSTSDSLQFDNFFNLAGGTAYALINCSSISFPSQTVSLPAGIGEIIFDGSGTMNGAGTEMTVSFNYTNTTPLIGGSGSCTAIIVKQ